MLDNLASYSPPRATKLGKPKICIMGIDPGLIATGFGVIEINDGGELRHCGSGVICPPSSWPFPQRLRQIYSGLTSQINQYKPDYMAVERPFFAKNVKSAMLLGEARGVAILAGAEALIDVFELSPLEIKQAVVGYGRAGKEQVQKMVCSLLNISSSLKSDVADALAVALCLAHTLPYKNLLKSLRQK